MLDLLGIDSSNFRLRQNYIDNNLVGVRNKIAHGERGIIGVDFSDFSNLCDYILEMLDKFKKVIIDSATKKCFLYKEDNNVG